MNCFCSYNIWLFWFGWHSISDAPTRTAFYVESSSCLFKCIDRSFGPSHTLLNTCAIVVNANDCGTRSKATTHINAAAESNDRVNLTQPNKWHSIASPIRKGKNTCPITILNAYFKSVFLLRSLHNSGKKDFLTHPWKFWNGNIFLRKIFMSF